MEEEFFEPFTTILSNGKKKRPGILIVSNKRLVFADTEDDAKTEPIWEISFLNIHAKNATKQDPQKKSLLKIVDKQQQNVFFEFTADSPANWDQLAISVEYLNRFLTVEHFQLLRDMENELNPSGDDSNMNATEVKPQLKKRKRRENVGIALDDATRLLAIPLRDGSEANELERAKRLKSLKSAALNLDPDLQSLYDSLVVNLQVVSENDFWTLHTAELAASQNQNCAVDTSSVLEPISLDSLKATRDSATLVGAQVLTEEEQLASAVVSRTPQLAKVYSALVPAHMSRGAFLRRLLRSRALYLLEGISPPSHTESDRLFDGVLQDLTNGAATRLRGGGGPLVIVAPSSSSVGGINPLHKRGDDEDFDDEKRIEQIKQQELAAASVAAQNMDSAIINSLFRSSAAGFNNSSHSSVPEDNHKLENEILNDLVNRANQMRSDDDLTEFALDDLLRVDDDSYLGNAAHPPQRILSVSLIDDAEKGPPITIPGSAPPARSFAGVRSGGGGSSNNGDTSTQLYSASILISRLNANSAAELVAGAGHSSGAPPRWQETLECARKGQLPLPTQPAPVLESHSTMVKPEQGYNSGIYLPDPSKAYHRALRKLVDLEDLHEEKKEPIQLLHVTEVGLLAPIVGEIDAQAGLHVGGMTQDAIASLKYQIQGAKGKQRLSASSLLNEAGGRQVFQEATTMAHMTLRSERLSLDVPQDIADNLAKEALLLRETAGHFWKSTLLEEEKRARLCSVLSHMGDQFLTASRNETDQTEGSIVKRCRMGLFAVCQAASHFNDTLSQLGSSI